jgi:uncharacterized protein
VLVLPPPSETKQSGGDGPPLRLEALSHPHLTPVRRKLVDELVALAGDVPAGLAALGLSERQRGELERNRALGSAPTLPALRRYTGVLYAALGADSLRPRQRNRLAVAVRAVWPARTRRRDTGLPALGRLHDARVGVGALGVAPGARSAARRPARPGRRPAFRCLPRAGTGGGGGDRTNHQGGRPRPAARGQPPHKAQKGRLARLLATAPREASDAADVARIARRGGLRIEQTAEYTLELIV